MRIVFAGTPQFAVPPLAALQSSRHEVVGVLTQPDRPAGRGRKLAASAVKEFALAHALEVAQPLTLRTADGRSALARWQPDLLVVVAYGLILPSEVLQLPRYGCLNIHASLLPRWRGAAPIQRALLAGDAQTGITLMSMDAGLDTGPMLSQHALPIAADADAASLQSALAALGASVLVQLIDDLEQGAVRPVSQPADGVTYAAKIDKAEARINWQHTATEIAQRVRAFNPWPIAETTFGGEQLRLHRAQAITTEVALSRTFVPGAIIGLNAEQLLVACGEGVLAITQLQRAGRRAISAREFNNAVNLQDVVFV